MDKQEAKKIIMAFADDFNESYSHYIISEDVDKFLDSTSLVKESNVIPYVSNIEARVSVCDHVWIMSADSFDQTCYCKKCGKSD